MKKLLIISTILLGLVTTSCNNYLDINQDPNSPSEDNVTSSMLMPGAEMNLAGSYGCFLRMAGGFHAQQYTQQFGSSNYLDFSQFQMNATRSNDAYDQLMSRALKNLETIRTKSSAKNEWGTYLAATTLRAFVFETLVDCYGEVPYTEALNSDNATPKFDDGQTIYTGILKELDDALSKASSSDIVCTNFLFPSAKADSWIKFAKALKLKILMRESNVDDVKNQISALITENDFPTSDVAYSSCWANQSGSYNPYFAEEFSTSGKATNNTIANLAIVGTMQVTDASGDITYTDPRLSKFFAVNGSSKYAGSVSGTSLSTSKAYNATSFSRPAITYNSPVYLLTVSEIEFFKAEYYARYGTADDAESHYDAAVKASFQSAGISNPDESLADYLKVYPYDNVNYKKSIGIAKWVALSGTNNFEAWCEMRRLNFPTFGTVKGDDLYDSAKDVIYTSKYVPGTLYTPILVYGPVGEGKILERYPYAEHSSARNSNAPSFPGYTSPVFWGK
ncbi:MAG TPA: SusD/RagB family nutrient-binding outer membrane lipoprotein [Xylanibacter oryzae]|uniref:SusD/RagB family nutrient-binding outer membrane lipoprotein n=1 Tax=Xylanibacter oryzae TaxID=185293 RepID=UPI0004B450FE|nr:SusD/RagB family nutrient-binding outer membrane lipoprotein [Xylanibacter oryzae]HRN15945.1 SusD/RagB family nutrient-binding outer membrane lipoprotein [Xylanibacter oryzae]